MSNLSKRLKQAREKKKLKQIQVKERTGINNKTLSGYENGVSEPDAETLKTLAELYNVSIDWLISGTIKKQEHEYALPENIYDNVIREAEEHYKVILRDDPVVLDAIKKMIDIIAQTKMNNKDKIR